MYYVANLYSVSAAVNNTSELNFAWDNFLIFCGPARPGPLQIAGLVGICPSGSPLGGPVQDHLVDLLALTLVL